MLVTGDPVEEGTLSLLGKVTAALDELSNTAEVVTVEGSEPLLAVDGEEVVFPESD